METKIDPCSIHLGVIHQCNCSHYCSVHRAAPRMLAALREAEKLLGNDPRWKVSALRLEVIRPVILEAQSRNGENHQL